jgi:tetratricopeptide (TPR) repeat protein
MVKRSIVLIVLILVVLPGGFAQQAVIDSLKRQLQQTAGGKERVQLELALSGQLTNINLFEALEYSDQAITQAVSLRDDSLESAAYLNQGHIFLQLGNYPRALQLYQRVIQGIRDTRYTAMTAIAYGNIGSIYYYRKDNEHALKYYTQSLGQFSELPEDRPQMTRRANLMNNIGVINEEARRFDVALQYYKDALTLGTQLNDHEVMANVINNYGTLYEDQDSVAKAFIYYVRAMKLRESYDNRFGMVRSYHNLGQFYTGKMNNPDSAIHYLGRSIALGKMIGAWQTVGSGAELLSRAYRRKGDYQQALEALAYHQQVNDSLFNQESTRKIAQMEMQFEFDRKQDQLQSAQYEKELYFWMAGGTLFFLLIIVTLLFILQRSKARRSQRKQERLMVEHAYLKNDLAVKDKQLALNIMYLLNKNELILNISEKLIEIKQNLGEDSQAALQKVVLDLQSNVQPELWKEFEYRFQEVHEQFYKSLNERFPDLTPSERRLCAFLKLNMTTKEISALTHQNAKSIDVARTRLRKKLNLTGTDQNLIIFLATLDAPEVREAEVSLKNHSRLGWKMSK